MFGEACSKCTFMTHFFGPQAPCIERERSRCCCSGRQATLTITVSSPSLSSAAATARASRRWAGGEAATKTEGIDSC